ncbi:EpsG family protein [Photobacterium leiognathi]|uniref:EpsG family protein n=1 Tax=Photobacterium leiognathi TaxID=553611 RepID=UPI002981CC31|nr:EpsG family protein [Photobacterium leiognathi]
MNLKNNNHLIILFIVVIPVLFSFLSFMRGGSYHIDYYEYLNFFNSIKGGYEPSVRIYDLGFIYITKVFSFLDFDQFLWFVVMLSFMIKSISVYLISPRSAFFFVIFYVISTFFLHELIQTRLALGIAFFYLATYFYIKKTYLLFILFTVIATSFHLSILFAVIFLFFNKKRNIFLILLAAILFVEMNLFSGIINYLSIFNDSFRQYTIGMRSINSIDYKLILNSYGVLLPFYSLIIILLFSKKDEMTFYEYKIFIINVNFMICSIFFFIFFTSLFSDVVGTRIAELLVLFQPLYWAIFIKNKIRQKNIIAITLILLSCVSYSYVYMKTFFS